MIKCENCLGKFTNGWRLQHTTDGRNIDLCSESCLTSYAWKLREREPKLSKSKIGAEKE